MTCMFYLHERVKSERVKSELVSTICHRNGSDLCKFLTTSTCT